MKTLDELFMINNHHQSLYSDSSDYTITTSVYCNAKYHFSKYHFQFTYAEDQNLLKELQ